MSNIDELNIVTATNFNTIELEKKLKKYNLNFPKDTAKQDDIENTKFPAFAYSFYELIIEEKIIPTQSRFFNYYISSHKKETVKVKDHILRIGDLSKSEKRALKSRIYKRSYPSLIRDFHFSLLAKEKTLFKVYTNLKMDIEEGIDMLIDHTYAIHLWLVTRASMRYRQRKYKYRHDYDNSEYNNLELPLDPFNIMSPNKHNGQKVGSFFLYSINEVDYMTDMILGKHDSFQPA
ncbi:MAG: hypothetical protein ACOCRX_10915 [Candidatus Woesearchaeota archaeon]